MTERISQPVDYQEKSSRKLSVRIFFTFENTHAASKEWLQREIKVMLIPRTIQCTSTQ
jgi:hypothetical protein